MVLLCFVFLFVAVVLIVGIAARRQKGIRFHEEEMGEMVRHLYYYLVLFATLMMSIGGSVGIFMSAADYISPTTYYQTFEEYREIYNQPGKDTTAISDEKLRKEYDEMLDKEKQRTRDNALNGIIKGFGWIIIPLPVFLYFQKQIRKKDGK